MIAFSGVRSSWLMFARNCDLCREAASSALIMSASVTRHSAITEFGNRFSSSACLSGQAYCAHDGGRSVSLHVWGAGHRLQPGGGLRDHAAQGDQRAGAHPDRSGRDRRRCAGGRGSVQSARACARAGDRRLRRLFGEVPAGERGWPSDRLPVWTFHRADPRPFGPGRDAYSTPGAACRLRGAQRPGHADRYDRRGGVRPACATSSSHRPWSPAARCSTAGTSRLAI